MTSFMIKYKEKTILKSAYYNHYHLIKHERHIKRVCDCIDRFTIQTKMYKLIHFSFFRQGGLLNFQDFGKFRSIPPNL